MSLETVLLATMPGKRPQAPAARETVKQNPPMPRMPVGSAGVNGSADGYRRAPNGALLVLMDQSSPGI
jgi:hypothetical protein